MIFSFKNVKLILPMNSIFQLLANSIIVYIFFLAYETLINVIHNYDLLGMFYYTLDCNISNITIVSSIIFVSSNLKLDKSDHLFFTVVTKPIKIKIIKRTMFGKAAAKTAKEVSKHAENPLTPGSRNLSYSVRETNVMTTTHEQSQVNPILGKRIDKTFQHNTYSENICDQSNCENKLCKTPCGPIIESTDVAHGTHQPAFPTARFLSKTDLENNNRPQYGVFYEKGVPNKDTQGKTTDQAKTAQLNKDHEHLSNVHMHVKTSVKKEKEDFSHNKTKDDENIN